MYIYRNNLDRGMTISVIAGSERDGRPNLTFSVDGKNEDQKTCPDPEAAQKDALSWQKKYISWLVFTLVICNICIYRYRKSLHQIILSNPIFNPQNDASNKSVSSLTVWFIIAINAHALWNLLPYIWRSPRSKAAPGRTHIIQGLNNTTNDRIPISRLAISILERLSTAAALYIVFLIVANLEILLLLPLIIKQRGYSYVYKELSTPMVGPVFLTQMKQFGFAVLDGVFVPSTWFATMAAGR